MCSRKLNCYFWKQKFYKSCYLFIYLNSIHVKYYMKNCITTITQTLSILKSVFILIYNTYLFMKS